MGSYEQGFKYDNYTYDPYSGTSTPHLELPHEPPSRGLSRLGSWGFLDPLNILRVCSDFGGREGGVMEDEHCPVDAGRPSRFWVKRGAWIKKPWVFIRVLNMNPNILGLYGQVSLLNPVPTFGLSGLGPLGFYG